MPLQTQLNEDLNEGSRSSVLTLFLFSGVFFFLGAVVPLWGMKLNKIAFKLVALKHLREKKFYSALECDSFRFQGSNGNSRYSFCE